jgi:hypothetical protein
MTKIGTYPSSVQNLQFLSNEVFNLNEEDEFREILKYLLTIPHPEEGTNLTTISNNIQSTRKIITNRLRGSSRIEGLVPLEYLNEKNENKHRWGKDQTSFHLRFKGMLAALSLGYSLDKIYLYDEYLKYLRNFVRENKLLTLIDHFLKSQIHLFLLYHYYHKINLKKTINFDSYYLSHVSTDFANETLKQEKHERTKRTLLKIISHHFTTEKILERIGIHYPNVIIAPTKFFLLPTEYKNESIILDDPDYTTEPVIIKPKKPSISTYELFVLKKLRLGLGYLILEWPHMIEKYHLKKDNFSIEEEIKELRETRPPTKESEFVNYKMVKSFLKGVGIDTKKPISSSYRS